jgi:hypothetical protein
MTFSEKYMYSCGMRKLEPLSKARYLTDMLGRRHHGRQGMTTPGAFDFFVDTWAAANRRMPQPLSGKNDWEGFPPISECRRAVKVQRASTRVPSQRTASQSCPSALRSKRELRLYI